MSWASEVARRAGPGDRLRTGARVAATVCTEDGDGTPVTRHEEDAHRDRC